MLPLLSSWNLQMLKGSRQPPMEAAKPGILMVSRKQPKRVPEILNLKAVKPWQSKGGPSRSTYITYDLPVVLSQHEQLILSFVFSCVISPARHAQPDANVVKTHDAACGRALKPLNGRGIVAKRRCRFRCSKCTRRTRWRPPRY